MRLVRLVVTLLIVTTLCTPAAARTAILLSHVAPVAASTILPRRPTALAAKHANPGTPEDVKAPRCHAKRHFSHWRSAQEGGILPAPLCQLTARLLPDRMSAMMRLWRLSYPPFTPP